MVDNYALTFVKADLHNYLRTSNIFSEGFAEKALERASKKLGKGAVIGVADVDEHRYSKVKRGAENYLTHDLGVGFCVLGLDITVLRGERVFTKEGNILVLGLNEDEHVQSGRSIEDTLKQAKDYNASIVLSNFSSRNKSREVILTNLNLLTYVDAVEVHNGSQVFTDQNNTAQLFYEVYRNKFDIGAIITSGGHSGYEIGSSWTLIPTLDYTSEAHLKKSIKEVLKQRRTPEMEHRSNSYIGATHHLVKHYLWSKQAGKRKIDERGMAE